MFPRTGNPSTFSPAPSAPVMTLRTLAYLALVVVPWTLIILSIRWAVS